MMRKVIRELPRMTTSRKSIIIITTMLGATTWKNKKSEGERLYSAWDRAPRFSNKPPKLQDRLGPTTRVRPWMITIKRKRRVAESPARKESSSPKTTGKRPSLIFLCCCWSDTLASPMCSTSRSLSPKTTGCSCLMIQSILYLGST